MNSLEMNFQEKTGAQENALKNESSHSIGISSFVLECRVFFLSPVFVPLAFVFGIIGAINNQMAWIIFGLICALLGFLTSLVLLCVFNMVSIGATLQRMN